MDPESAGVLDGVKVDYVESLQATGFTIHNPNAVRSRLLRDQTPDTGCGLKLFEREAFLDLPYFDHMHRYIPALMQRDGWATTSVPVNHRPRTAGASKYTNLGRLLVAFADLRGVAWLIRRSRRTPVREYAASEAVSA